MRVSLDQEGDDLIFHLEPDEDDFKYLDSTKIEIGERRARINLGGICKQEIHPDLIGLSTILICHQFIGKSLYLPVTVSEYFLESANRVLSKYKIFSEADSSIKPNSIPSNSRPGLAFSGGADSSLLLYLAAFLLTLIHQTLALSQ